MKIHKVDTPFNDSVILICGQCSDKSELLRTELKPLLKQKFDKSVRCMKSGCHGICPENKIAITKVSNMCSNSFQSYEVETDVSAQELLETLF
jgi:hypothetical protein